MNKLPNSPIIALLESVTRSPRERLRSHWLRRIIFHVVGRRIEHPGSARYRFAAYRYLPYRVAAFMLPAE